MSEPKMIFEVDFPTWALNYLFNDDSTGLTPDEVAMVEDWKEHKEFFTSIENAFFSKYPAFGLPCECIELKYCYAHDFETGG